MLFLFFYFVMYNQVWSTHMLRSVEQCSPRELPPCLLVNVYDFLRCCLVQNIITSPSVLLSAAVNHIYFWSGISGGLFRNYFFFLSNDISYHGILIINTLLLLFRLYFPNYTDRWACCEYCRLQTQSVKKFSFRITFIVLK